MQAEQASEVKSRSLAEFADGGADDGPAPGGCGGGAPPAQWTLGLLAGLQSSGVNSLGSEFLQPKTCAAPLMLVPGGGLYPRVLTCGSGCSSPPPPPPKASRVHPITSVLGILSLDITGTADSD